VKTATLDIPAVML